MALLSRVGQACSFFARSSRSFVSIVLRSAPLCLSRHLRMSSDCNDRCLSASVLTSKDSSRLSGLSFCVCLLHVLGETHREYVDDSWSSSFYQPHDVQVNHVGMVNAQAVYFATKTGVSMLHDGLLTPAVERHDSELVAFHMCHHRSSLFYEVLSKDGGVLTIYEYSLLAKESVKVAIFQETVPAKSLCCVDNLLLRASRSSLVAVSLSSGALGASSILQKFKDEQDVLGSLTAAFAADIVQHAQVYAVVPRNRSVVKLHLQEDTHGVLHLTAVDEVLIPGEGADGPTEKASVVQPHHVAWLHGKLLIVDGCSLRQVEEGRVKTLLGSPVECAEPPNETLSPASWTSRIAQPLGLAVEAEATTGHTVLVLTRGQVIQVTQDDGSCTESSHDTCIKDALNRVGRQTANQEQCGWVEDDRHNRCLGCSELHAWAEAQRPPLDPCLLQSSAIGGAGRADSVRYDLSACGCADIGLAGFMRVLLVLGIAAGVLFYCWRERQRRRFQQDMYGMTSDTVQFHTFNDQENDVYVRYDSSSSCLEVQTAAQGWARMSVLSNMEVSVPNDAANRTAECCQVTCPTVTQPAHPLPESWKLLTSDRQLSVQLPSHSGQGQGQDGPELWAMNKTNRLARRKKRKRMGERISLRMR
eukprot:s1515_g7.t1